MAEIGLKIESAQISEDVYGRVFTLRSIPSTNNFDDGFLGLAAVGWPGSGGLKIGLLAIGHPLRGIGWAFARRFLFLGVFLF